MRWAPKRKGFTIVELLIVVAVIAVLVAVMMVVYNGITNHASDAAAQSDLNQVAKKIMLYQTSNGSYPADLATLGDIQNEADYTYRNYVDHFCVAISVKGSSYQVVDGEDAQVGDCVNLAVTIYASSADYSFDYDSNNPLIGGTIAPVSTYYWNMDSILVGAPTDNFVAIIEGFLTPPVTDTYTFSTHADDRDMLYINGQLVVDGSATISSGWTNGTANFEAGKPVRFKVVFKEYAGNAIYEMRWQYTGFSSANVPASAINTVP